MKTLLAVVSFICCYSIAVSQSYTPTDAGSKAHFIIKNFGISTGGDFSGLKGQIEFNPDELNKSKFYVTVNAGTIDTDNNARDSHLRKEEYFDVAKYPLLLFSSTRVTKSSITGRFYMFGNLTIKGITKAVEFGFSATPNNKGYIFNGEFSINRRDFGVGGSSFSMSDNLKIVLTINAVK